MLVKRWPKIRSRCLIPCHRVLAAGGKIGGFSAPGGSAAKIRMLPTCSTGDRGFAELCLVGMRVTTMLDSDRDFKAVRFRDFLDGFPVLPLLCESEDLSSAALTQRLDRNGGGTHPRKAEARWHSRLEDRQFQHAVAGRDSLQFRPMHLI
jgi:hypothetical protein